MSPTDSPAVSLDAATTAPAPAGRPWEIAVTRRDDTGETVTLIQVSDVDLTGADPATLAAAGYHRRHSHPRPADAAAMPARVRPARIMVEATAAALVDDLTAGATIAADVPADALDAIAAMLARHGRTPSWVITGDRSTIAGARR